MNGPYSPAKSDLRRLTEKNLSGQVWPVLFKAQTPTNVVKINNYH